MKNPNVVISSAYGPIIINVNDTGVSKDIIDFGYWALDDIALIKALIDNSLEKKETITFYDVGANIGTYTLAVAKLYSPRAKIRAFEAQRNLYNMLCGTVAINGLIRNVYCHHNAVSNTDNETIEIALPDYDSPNNFGSLELIEPKNSDNRDMIKPHTEKIKTISIDSFEEKIDFIKIDIEGMEDKALLGARKTIGAHKPICLVEVLKTDKEFVIDYFRTLHYVGYLKAHDLIVIPIEQKFGITGLERIF